jgi:hypothetical protein
MGLAERFGEPVGGEACSVAVGCRRNEKDGRSVDFRFDAIAQ